MIQSTDALRTKMVVMVPNSAFCGGVLNPRQILKPAKRVDKTKQAIIGRPSVIAPSSQMLWLLNQWALALSPGVAK